MQIKQNPFYAHFTASDVIPRSALVSQIRLLDIKRLTEKAAYTVNDADFSRIKKAIRKLFR
jgi:hypothetical protein